MNDDRPFPNLVIVGRDLPDVMECHGHSGGALLEPRTCPQCDGSHKHVWIECLVLDRAGSLIGVATRCRICGGRKCGDDRCNERRHHAGPHLGHGRIRRVGA